MHLLTPWVNTCPNGGGLLHDTVCTMGDMLHLLVLHEIIELEKCWFPTSIDHHELKLSHSIRNIFERQKNSPSDIHWMHVDKLKGMITLAWFRSGMKRRVQRTVISLIILYRIGQTLTFLDIIQRKWRSRNKHSKVTCQIPSEYWSLNPPDTFTFLTTFETKVTRGWHMHIFKRAC
jgi:hypothetical protein